MISYIKKNKEFILMCLICLIPRIILAFFALPFRTRADEMGSLAGAAYVAGLDWSDITSNMSYYGFGATVIFAPLFHFFKNPLVIYKIMIAIWGMLQASIGCIAWRLGKTYFKIQNKRILLLLSLVASYSVVTKNTAVFNETPMVLVAWLIVWILMYLNKNHENKKKRCLATIGLSFLMAYSLTLHTRAIIFFAAVILVGAAYMLVTKKSLFSIPTLGICGVTGYVLAKYVVTYMQDMIWMNETRSYVTNTAIGFGGLSRLGHVESWQAWFNIVLGQLNTLSLITGTIIIVAVIWFFWKIIIIIKNKLTAKEEDFPFLCVAGFALVCILGTIVGQSISEWLEYAVVAMKSGMNNNAYGLKGFTYIRYVGPYIGVLVWVILILTVKRFNEIKKIKGSIIATIVLLNTYWLVCVLPYIYHNPVTNEAYLPFGLINNIEDETRLRVYLSGTIVIAVFLILFWVLFSLKKYQLFLSIFSAFLIYQFCYGAYYNDIYLMRKSFNEVEMTYNTINEIDFLPDRIYVDDCKNSSHMVEFVYQFCFFDKKVIPIDNSEVNLGTNDLLITNGCNNLNEYVNNGYSVFIVDEENESALVTENDEIIAQLMEKGYNYLP